MSTGSYRQAACAKAAYWDSVPCAIAYHGIYCRTCGGRPLIGTYRRSSFYGKCAGALERNIVYVHFAGIDYTRGVFNFFRLGRSRSGLCWSCWS